MVKPTFDAQSGQVFQQWTVPRPEPALDKEGRDWSRRAPYPILKGRSPQGAKGPRSLVEMTVNVIADNVGYMSSEHIENIPPRQQWRIWRFLEARWASSLHQESVVSGQWPVGSKN